MEIEGRRTFIYVKCANRFFVCFGASFLIRSCYNENSKCTRCLSGEEAAVSDQSATGYLYSITSTSGPHLAVAQPRHNLAQPLNRFVGRVEEKAVVQRLLATARLLTLIGAGGSGKTRLALEVAHAIAGASPPLSSTIPSLQFPDGIWWVELAPLADPTLLAQMVLSTLGFQEQPGLAATQVLVDAFASRQTLLVLDNCEHLATACAGLVAALLRACPRLCILATSREPLGVADETVWVTPPLAPDEAADLFMVRATAVLPNFGASPPHQRAIAHICQQLEGLPLAIELAAARLKVLSAEQIAARLDNAFHLLVSSDHDSMPTRQQTMHATLDWSHALLNRQEQMFFARLAVFAGSFDLGAVEAVCTGGGLESCAMLDLIMQLANKSLLVVEHQADEARYRFLEPVRQYAVEKLHDLGEEAHWRLRHVEWCVALAEQSDRELNKRGQVHWLQRLERELANLRAAFDWSRNDDSCTVLGLRLVVALYRFWNLQSRRREGRLWLDQFNTDSGTLPVALRASAFFCGGRLAYNQFDFVAASAQYKASIALCRTAQLYQQHAQALEGLGYMLLALGEQEEAAIAFQESLAIAEATNAPAEIVMALRGLGLVAQARKAFAQARTHYEAGLACCRASEDHFRTGHLLEHLGYLCLAQDDYPTARTYYLEFLALEQQTGATDREAQALIGLASLALKDGNTTQAQQFYKEGLVLLRAVNKPQRIVDVLNHLAALAQRQGAVQEAQTYYTEALALRDQVRKTNVIETLSGLGDLALVAGDDIQARDHYLEALALAHTLGGPSPSHVDPAMPMVLARAMGAQSWVEILHEKLARIFASDIRHRPLPAMPAEDTSAAQPAHPVALQIYAFGPTRVYAGGRQLTAADWVYARAKELLLYLLIYPRTTREQIGLEFWPDASTEQVRSRFSAVLTHARKALGRDHDWITCEAGRYVLNHTADRWFDVEVFEAKLRAAHKHLRCEPRQVTEAIACLEAAIDLYQGEFAADLVEGEWQQHKRTQLRQAFEDALLTLGGFHFEAGRYEQAAKTYRHALAYDCYLEAAHRELMRSLARQGEHGLALQQYETLVHTLQELEAPPSTETRVLAERLRRGERI
jgi:predicted ATPase/DNA-binding SARP family transcriptional activator